MAFASSDFTVFIKTAYKSLQPIEVGVTRGCTIDVEKLVLDARAAAKKEAEAAKKKKSDDVAEKKKNAADKKAAKQKPVADQQFPPGRKQFQCLLA